MREWLEFTEIADTGKTKIWNVNNRKDHSFLGQVKWHGAWRQYCFSTLDTQECIWNADCLAELTAFIKKQMWDRK